MNSIRRFSAEALSALAGKIGGHGLGERLPLKGSWEFVLTDRDGKLKDYRKKDNLITDVGFQFLADASFIASGRPAIGNYTAIGATSTAPAAGNTALGSQLARQTNTYSYAAKVATLSTTFAAGTGTGAVVEAGILNASTAGTLLNRVTFTVINKGALDTLAVNFTLTLS